MTHRLVTLLFALFSLAGWPGLAAAHSVLHHSEPARNAILDAPPKAVKLQFSKALEPAFSTLKVYSGDGKQVDDGKAQVTGEERKGLEVALPALPSGTYKVLWSIVAQDGHKMRGDFIFTIK